MQVSTKNTLGTVNDPKRDAEERLGINIASHHLTLGFISLYAYHPKGLSMLHHDLTYQSSIFKNPTPKFLNNMYIQS